MAESTMKREEILCALKEGSISVEQAAQLLSLEEATRASLHCRVSEKGGLSVYGLGRMPVTLYVNQWRKLLGFSEQILAFANAHEPELKATPPRRKPANKPDDAPK